MRCGLRAAAFFVLAIGAATAQVASHAPTAMKAELNVKGAPTAPAASALDKPVARVNGSTLTERDLMREMYAMFPYARQHGGGVPVALEPEIRKGALQMIIFEELVYQEARRRRLVIPTAAMTKAEADFRKRFPSPAQYQQYLKLECQGSTKVLRERIRRSLLIDALLKAEVQDKSAVSVAEARAYYDKNSKQFEKGESFSIQTISIIPPEKAGPEVQKEARKRAEDALKQARQTKNFREFGLLAEKVSDDDWHVDMGNRKDVEAAKLPPPIVAAARKMKPGEVSDLFQFGPNYTLFRMNKHGLPGKTSFAEVKTQLRSDLRKSKAEKLRSELNQRLQKTAKVEVL